MNFGNNKPPLIAELFDETGTVISSAMIVKYDVIDNAFVDWGHLNFPDIPPGKTIAGIKFCTMDGSPLAVKYFDNVFSNGGDIKVAESGTFQTIFNGQLGLTTFKEDPAPGWLPDDFKHLWDGED